MSSQKQANMNSLIEVIKISKALKEKSSVLVRRISLRLDRMCETIAYSANLKQGFLLFSYLDFRVYFAFYPPESFKIICLTCIWSKFVDTRFHSPQKPAKNSSRRDRHFYHICSLFQTNRLPDLKKIVS